MTPPRIVLDTNVLLSALLFRAGMLSWLRMAWQEGVVCPLISPITTDELIRVLSYPKFNLRAREQDDLLADYLPWCETVMVSGSFDVPHCRDPFDLPFLELALAARANAVVTGDKGLLGLSPGFPVPILTPRLFRKRMSLAD